MVLDDVCFEVSEPDRTSFVNGSILIHFPEDQRPAIQQRTIDLVTRYQGVDRDALSLLAYAAERQQFAEFAGRMDTHYTVSLAFVHPAARRSSSTPGAHRAAHFFLGCYRDLEITPSATDSGKKI